MLLFILISINFMEDSKKLFLKDIYTTTGGESLLKELLHFMVYYGLFKYSVIETTIPMPTAISISLIKLGDFIQRDLI